jgi:UDP-N-acetylmuramoyl-L-alanyl-D-glutamate--2,6-diaminopimelate ligase
MRLIDMVAHLPEPPDWYIPSGLTIAGITADSRRVNPGDLFVALPGRHADGRRFIADAVERGAAAILAPSGTEWPPGVPPRPLLTDAEPRRRLAQLAALAAGPGPDCTIAVTGTNGKTSTVDFLRQIAAPQKAASLGTLGVVAPAVPALEHSGGLTTPDPVVMAETLAALARAGVRIAALEASSHGLDQYRLDGVRLSAAGFSNLTRDHLDYHAHMAAYRTAKLRLFAELLPEGAPAIANADMDPETLAELRGIAARRHLKLRTVGEAGDTLRLLRAEPTPDGQTLQIERAGTRHDIALALPGRFQADNALLAAALAEATFCSDALPRLSQLIGVRGRMELAARLANGAAAYVDYAHTPDALTRLLAALRPHARRLVVVFGAGGDRDPGKRAPMGEAAAQGADRVIVTDDNPRTENPAAIRAAVLLGCPGATEIGDRAAAIAAGLAALGPGDVLAVAGKGHEPGQIVGTTVLPFDDVETVRRLTGTA